MINKRVALIFTIVAVLATAAFAKQRYDGHSVIRFNVQSQAELERLTHFVNKHGLDVWTHLSISDNVDVRIPPELQDDVIQLQISNDVFIPDIQQRINVEEYSNKLAKLAESGKADDFFKAYHTYDEIVSYTKNLASNYSDIARFITIGNSLKGLPIVAIIISGEGGNSTAKPGIVINSLQHAREWVTGATVTYMMNQLVSLYGSDDVITSLLNEFEFTFIPVSNPDGYTYSWTTDRMWRKNLRPQGGVCIGIDTNRNWDDHFVPDSVFRGCEQTFNGPSPFSEPETQAISGYIARRRNVIGYIDVHAYSQLWMWSYGWTSQLPPNQAALKECAVAAVTALEAVNGIKYKYGNVYTVIYPAASTSIDWAYTSAGVKYPYAIELRDTGRYGFILPPDQILPTAIETFAGVKAMAMYIAQNN